MRRIGLLSALAGLVLLAPAAHADYIVNLGAGTGTTTLGLTPSGTDIAALTARDFTAPIAGIVPNSAFTPGTQVNNDDTALGASNPNQVKLSLDVFALHTPFDVVFQTKPATGLPTGGGVLGSAEYFFTVELTNALNANGVDPNNAGHPITGFDVEIYVPDAAEIAEAGFVGNIGPDLGVKFDTPLFTPVPTGSPIGFLNPLGILSPTLLRFGGIFGGGTGIAPSETATLTFSIDVPAGSNVNPPSYFGLRFVANPEPGSMALGAVALGVGGWLVRRRKSKKGLKTPAGAAA